MKDQKHLGLTLAPNLSFSKQIHKKLSKEKKIIGIITHIRENLSTISQKCLRTVREKNILRLYDQIFEL